MKARDFAFWLQGFIELAKPDHLGSEETEVIKNHLNMVRETEKLPPPGLAGFPLVLHRIIVDLDHVSKDGFVIVKKLLDAEFVHIDKNTPGDPETLEKLHKKPGQRC
jgi:hypothetical protein